MDQEIKFCTTADGVSIAYATLGSGPPLVYVCGWPGNLAIEWEHPFAREFIQSFATEFTLVRYDMRNTGLSQQTRDDISLDALVLDLEAVVDHLDLQQFSLMSLGLLAGPVAFTYAGKHPDRVSRVVALGPFLRGTSIITEQQYRALSDYAAAFGRIAGPDDFRDPERHGIDQATVKEASAIHEAGAPPAILPSLLETLFRTDLTDAVEHLETPVLVMHGSGDGRVPLEATRQVASRLKNVQFVPYEGSGAAPWADTEFLLPQIFKFLGAPPPKIAPKRRQTEAAGMVSILFTDMESSTALTQRLGDAAAQDIRRAHNDIVRVALSEHGGSEVKHTGDGIMASFTTASSALESAIAIQQGVAAHVEQHPDSPLAVYIGLNAGEPIAEEQDLFGTSVDLAARICDQAQPGQILASDVVRQLAAGKQFLFADLGETALRGFEDPVKLWEVRWREQA